ncbi:phage filamentation protein Fil family protein [Enterobacter sp.]|uniref:phage filamentation protein Fil family protein n=1 Tax=Enterobacter sp. TaxID=42895 RepID=UPI0008EB3F7B|nr:MULTISPECIES: phage filamentation protein Fil family protein [unclassified Enterobacter]SFR13765.1 hypothetical protein SAMN04487773_3233 [Enterobacter sp. kpr-6]
MKPFVTYLKRQSPPQQLTSFGNGWLELQNGQRWNPGMIHKFNAHEPVQFKGGNVLRFLSTKARNLTGMIGGRNGN